MGKIVASASVTFDGIFTGASGDEDNMISWALPGVQETGMDNLSLFQKADAILMGRVTYEGLSSFWPSQEGEWGDAMNKTKKYVAAGKNHLQNVQWGSYPDTIELINGDVEKRVQEIKKEIQGDIVIPASSKLVQSLLNDGLIDEFHTIVHTVVLGSGRRYLEDIDARHDLKVVYTRFYEQSGCMLFHYEVVR